MYRFCIGLITILFLFFGTGCQPSMYVPKGSYLLYSSPKFKGNPSLDRDLLNSGIKTEANRSVGSVKLFLHLFNWGYSLRTDTSLVAKVYKRLDNEQFHLKKISYWLMFVMGEPPELVDTAKVRQDAENLTQIYRSHGYLNAEITTEYRPVKNVPRALNVFFNIKEKEKFILNQIRLQGNDSQMLAIVLADSAHALLKQHDLYNEDNFVAERTRITTLLKQKGYFRMSPTFIEFEVDTSSTIRSSALNRLMVPKPLLNLFNATNRTRYANVTIQLPDSVQQYTFGDIRIRLRSSVETRDSTLEIKAESLTQEKRIELGLSERKLSLLNPFTFFVQRNKRKSLNFNFLSTHIRMIPDSLYTLESTRLTQEYLQNLGIFKNIFLNYEVQDSLRKVNVNLNLTRVYNNYFQVGFEAFQSEDKRLNSNLPGLGARIQYINRNIFRRAEKLELSMTGSLSFYTPDSAGKPRAFYQFIPKFTLTFPRLLLPWQYSKDVGSIRPQTIFSLVYNSENRLEFSRNSIGLNVNYTWYKPAKIMKRHQIYPLDFNVISSQKTASFEELLNNLSPTIREFVKRDYVPRYSEKVGYYYTLSNYQMNKYTTTWYLRAGVELGGNLAYLIDWIGKKNDKGDKNVNDGLINGRYLYGQFIRSSVELKMNKPILKNLSFIGRCMLGYAEGLNATKIVPFENRFFMGGTSSVRGWQSNTLGPGTFQKTQSNLVTYGGEYMFESNIELRHGIWKYFKGAWFIDMGNVWFSKKGGFDNPEGKLSTQTLRLGISAGVGLRLDFSFLVLRMDLGQQVYDPAIKDWVVKHFPKDLGARRIQYNLGIGMPF